MQVKEIVKEKEFDLRKVHTCEAVVLSCIDFRFWESVSKFVKNDLGIEDFDLASIPGGVKSINESDCDGVAGGCVKIPCELHNVKKIILVNHKDCGAYGGSSNFENSDKEDSYHIEELKKAKEIISKKYPDKEVLMLYPYFSEDGKQIKMSIVE